VRAPLPLLVFPFNGNGLEALDCLGDAYRLVGFVDDTPEKQGRDRRGFEVFDRSAFVRWPEARVLAVPGGPASFRNRKQVVEGLGVDPDRYATVIHPAARIGRFVSIGHNVLLMAGVVVTSNAVIGDHVCILPNSVVHHDTKIGAWTLVGSGVTMAGGVTVEDNCYVGSGSSVRNDVTIGAGALVGLGSNVVRDVAAGRTVAGNPARERP
jgi:sugar O-acyltransferase (sialic acid O-acetyltransferase NeuD family)